MAQVSHPGDVELALTGRELGDVRDQRMFGRDARKSRRSRSGAGAMSGRPRLHFRRGFTPTYDRGQLLVDLAVTQLLGGEAISDFQGRGTWPR